LHYQLASQLLRKRGVLLEPAAIRNEILQIARAEAVPPWRKTQWDTLLETFQKCQLVGESLPDVPSDHVRLCFTHQPFSNGDVAAMDQHTVEALRRRIATDGWKTIMDVYKKAHLEWIERETKALENLHEQDGHHQAKKLLKELKTLPVPPFDRANAYVDGIKNLLHVVRTYFCMQSLIVVCSIRKIHIKHVNAMVMAWVSVLSHALEQRRVFTERVRVMLPGVPNVLQPDPAHTA
jgi:hypothetical protein